MAEGFAAYWWAALRQGLPPDPQPSACAKDPLLGALAAACALLALTLYLGGGYHAGFAPLNALGSVPPQWPWHWVTTLGDERVVAALALLIAWRHPRLLWALALAGLLGALCSRGLKPLLDTARPPAVLAEDSFNLIGPLYRRGSFPSGHSITAALTLGVGLCFTRGWHIRLGLVLLALGIAFSRVVVGAHWPVDVLAGLALGFAAAWVGVLWSQRYRWGIQPVGHLILVGATTLFVLLRLPHPPPYAAAVWLVQPLGGIALVLVLWEYGLSPWRRWLGLRARTPR